MASKDYVPKKDEDFDIFQTNVVNTAMANSSKWLIPSQVMTQLATPRQRWTTAYTAYKNPATRTTAVTQEKIDARKDYEPQLRVFIQGQLMHNSQVTDADRRSMGLPVYDREPTPATTPKTRPEVEIRFEQIMEHSVHVRDSESKSAGKPEHVIGFEIWRFAGDHEPAYDEMQFAELATRSPHILQYAAADRSKTVWYAARWVNSRGEKGPWSEIVSAIVP